MASIDAQQLSMAQQPSQQNVFQTATAPTVMQQLAQYRALVQQISNPTVSDASTQQSMSQNPWAPDEINPKDLKQADTDHSAWLTTQPISAQTYKTFDNQTHANILRNLQEDPAVKEIQEPFMGILEQLKGYVDQGIITKDQAMQHLSEAAPMIEEAVNRHHNRDTGTQGHLLTVDPDLHVQPEIAQKARAAKGGK